MFQHTQHWQPKPLAQSIETAPLLLPLISLYSMSNTDPLPPSPASSAAVPAAVVEASVNALLDAVYTMPVGRRTMPEPSA